MFKITILIFKEENKYQPHKGGPAGANILTHCFLNVQQVSATSLGLLTILSNFLYYKECNIAILGEKNLVNLLAHIVLCENIIMHAWFLQV